MYQVGDYERFSIADVNKFERRIYKWCREEYTPERTLLVFDRSSLLVKGKLEVYVRGTENFCKLVLPNITLEYIIVAGDMCILSKIRENASEKIIYDLPKSWKSTQLWYAF